MQSQSHVLDILKAMDTYYWYWPYEKSVKEDTLYGFYTRSTIPWNLDCESNGISRQTI